MVCSCLCHAGSRRLLLTPAILGRAASPGQTAGAHEARPQALGIIYVLGGFLKIRPQLLLFATLLRTGQGRDLGLGGGFLIIAPKAQHQKKK